MPATWQQKGSCEVRAESGTGKQVSSLYEHGVSKIGGLFIILLYLLLNREYGRAAESAFQSRSLEQLGEVEQKASRIPNIMETVRTYQSKLGYK